MTMTTGGIQPTTTMAAMSAATSSSMGGMGGMGGGKCKISMLINYNTIGACFISDEWKITSTGMFAGSCIGVVVMSIFLEFLRRSVKEFDKYLVKQHISKHSTSVVSTAVDGKETQESKGDVVPPFRPNFWQQGIRAALHTAQFTVAYFIMLLGVSLFVIFSRITANCYSSNVLQCLHPRFHLHWHSDWLLHLPVRDTHHWVS